METEVLDFTRPWSHSDIAFILEGRKVHANKTILSIWSPVMQAMFRDDFKERNTAEIVLPGKIYRDFVELMHVVHPPNKDIDGSNVCQLLPLSHKYQMTKVTERCEKFLLSQPPSVKNLVLADNYNLQQLLHTCTLYAKKEKLGELKKQPHFDKINASTLVNILSYKVEKMESIMRSIKDVVILNKTYTFDTCRSGGSKHRLGTKKECSRCKISRLQKIEQWCDNDDI